MLNYYFLLITAIVSYIIVIDKNVAPWLILNWKLFVVNLERAKFMVIYHPRNPITNWLAARRYRRIAKEIHDQLSNKASLETDPSD